jgi:hypothetical protein
MSGENPSNLPAPEEFWNEFRAIYSAPATFLSSPEEQARGYAIRRTEWYESPDAAKNAAITAFDAAAPVRIIGMEQSWVTRSKIESISL